GPPPSPGPGPDPRWTPRRWPWGSRWPAGSRGSPGDRPARRPASAGRGARRPGRGTGCRAGAWPWSSRCWPPNRAGSSPPGSCARSGPCGEAPCPLLPVVAPTPFFRPGGRLPWGPRDSPAWANYGHAGALCHLGGFGLDRGDPLDGDGKPPPAGPASDGHHLPLDVPHLRWRRAPSGVALPGHRRAAVGRAGARLGDGHLLHRVRHRVADPGGGRPVPWNYGGAALALGELIRLDYAPAWFLLGLGL